MPFEPNFIITSRIANALMRIEAAREAVRHLPITPSVLTALRETARLYSTHYSTQIEGNRLTQEQVSRVVERHGHFPGRERDEREVLGYYAALEKVERFAAAGRTITEQHIQILHALVMAGGASKVKPSAYRDGQNVIRDSRSRGIVYLPPEAGDVPVLMSELTAWLRVAEKQNLPCPLRAGIAHYQFATIHPYYDGNGRTARLLTTLALHLGAYDLKGLYSLEEYYARNLAAYYDALTVGTSHNYYEGRAAADITRWVEYFCDGMAESFENVKSRAQAAAGAGEPDQSRLLRQLDPRLRKALELFRRNEHVTSRDVEALFGVSQRTARNLLSEWTGQGFLVIADTAKKSRKYRLAGELLALVTP
ncbi:MAG TPA: Fic family protein [Verrucomicrobiae bacterium]|nr:Fic family protein [Verrucomicrobiae bacterium]